MTVDKATYFFGQNALALLRQLQAEIDLGLDSSQLTADDKVRLIKGTISYLDRIRLRKLPDARDIAMARLATPILEEHHAIARTMFILEHVGDMGYIPSVADLIDAIAFCKTVASDIARNQ